MAWYPARGLPAPLELLNTQFFDAGQPRDALQTLTDLHAWLASVADKVPGAATDGDLEAVRRLRTALREIFAAAATSQRPPEAAVAYLNELSATAPQVARLDWRGDQPHCTMVTVGSAEPSALASLVRASIELLVGPDGQRIGACQAPGCMLFYLKQGRQAWCSPTCGNRARVARHYHRHRAASP